LQPGGPWTRGTGNDKSTQCSKSTSSRLAGSFRRHLSGRTAMPTGEGHGPTREDPKNTTHHMIHGVDVAAPSYGRLTDKQCNVTCRPLCVVLCSCPRRSSACYRPRSRCCAVLKCWTPSSCLQYTGPAYVRCKSPIPLRIPVRRVQLFLLLPRTAKPSRIVENACSVL
jgi:hypothetical protein